MKQKTFLYLWIAFSLCETIADAQPVTNPQFKVEGEVKAVLTLGQGDLLRFGTSTVTGKDKDEKEHRFKGVLLYKILDSAGVALGKQLRGQNLAKYVSIEANDGYKVVFALPELDPEFTDKVVLVAYEMDGEPLPKGDGPFRIVVPSEKKHARWVRGIGVVRIVSSK